MLETIAKLIEPLQRRMRIMVARGIVNLVNDAGGLQVLQISLSADEVRDGIERFQQYGFTSAPFAGAEAIALSVNADRNQLVVISVDDRRYRLVGLQPGEVALYTDEGDYVKLARGKIIEVVSGTKVKITAPVLEVDGDVHVTGTLTADTDVVIAGLGHKLHKHGGVTVGAGVSGTPQ